MSIEYTPVDIACNLKCDYCYQDDMRDAGNVSSIANWDKAKAELERQNYRFSVFGGEPLLAPFEHLEEVFKFGLERFGGNGIQTNGTLITDEHIDLFKKYKVGVGISCDGPPQCNALRRGDNPVETDVLSQRTLDSIERLCRAGVIPSIIVTVHKLNGSKERRDDLMRWFTWLEDLGVRWINLHMLEPERNMGDIALTEDENREAFHTFYRYSLVAPKMNFQPFVDIYRLLSGDDANKVNCIWNACDPLTTRAVQGVARDGSLRNCGRTNKDGVSWLKAKVPGNERYIVLHNTPQEFGGCKDCRYFAFCKGNCPGTAIGGDWRNRSVHCSTWYHLFDTIERSIVAERRLPVSRDKREVERLIARMLGPSINVQHIDTPHIDSDRGVPVTWL